MMMYDNDTSARRPARALVNWQVTMILEGLILIVLFALLLAGLSVGRSTYDKLDPSLWPYVRH
jgi:hypothetical protein